MSALVFHFAESFCLNRMRVDDPVSAWALHGAVGVWAMLAVGLFAEPQYMQDVYGGVAFGDVHATKW